MNVIVDTCVWSETLRRNPPTSSIVSKELTTLILEHRVKMIGSVRQELLSGVRDKKQFDKLEKNLNAFPDIQLTKEDHVLAARFFNLCRSKGIQGSNTDFLICAVAVHHKLSIYTTDKVFSLFHQYIPLVLHEPKRN